MFDVVAFFEVFDDWPASVVACCQSFLRRYGRRCVAVLAQFDDVLSPDLGVIQADTWHVGCREQR